MQPDKEKTEGLSHGRGPGLTLHRPRGQDELYWAKVQMDNSQLNVMRNFLTRKAVGDGTKCFHSLKVFK